MVQGVIFDMDGLMFDTERMWATLWEPCCNALGLPLPGEEFVVGARGLAGENMLRHIRRYYPQIQPEALLNALNQAGEALFAKGVPVKPGLVELLDYLEQAGIPRIVASSSQPEVIRRNLKNTGTDRYFEDIVSGADVTYSKPDPEMFLEAARRIGIPPEHCLVLEDSYNGVRAGAAAHAVTVMVPDLMPSTPEMERLYTACCKDLFEVKAMLERGAL